MSSVIGLDPATMLSIFNSSSGRSGSTENKWPNFVLPQLDDLVTIKTREDTWVEQLGRKSSYTYQLEAFTGAIRQQLGTHGLLNWRRRQLLLVEAALVHQRLVARRLFLDRAVDAVRSRGIAVCGPS